MGIWNAVLILAIAIQLSAVIAAGPPGAPIVSCPAVGCPTGPDISTSANCIVAGCRSNLIGLANLKTSIAAGRRLDMGKQVLISGFSLSGPSIWAHPKASTWQQTRQAPTLAPAPFSSPIYLSKSSYRERTSGLRLARWNDAITTECANALIEQAQLAMGPASNHQFSFIF